MKTMRFISAILLATVMVFSFNACDDDEVINDDGENGKRVTKIVNEYSDFVRTETFSYSNGKLSEHTAYYTEDDDEIDIENDLLITYNGNTVTMKGILDGNESELVYSLSNGLATSCKQSIIEAEYRYEYNYTFQYSDGYLTSMSVFESDQNSNSTEIYTFTYSNGNLTKVIQQDKYDTNSNSFTYTNDLNKGSHINNFLREDLFNHIAAFYAGILGKATTNLPQSNGQVNVVYSFDNNGYVTSANSVEEKYTYSYE